MKSVRIDLTAEELAVVCSALNEVTECLDPREFETRVGESREVVELLHEKLLAQLRSII